MSSQRKSISHSPPRRLQIESLETRLTLDVEVALVANINKTNPWGEIKEISTSGSYVYLTASENRSELFLWRSDGTSSGTIRLTSLGLNNGSSRQLIDVGGTLYFKGVTDAHGSELWSTQGTIASTRMVQDLSPGPTSSEVIELTPFNGQLYFVKDGELYTANATSASKAVDIALSSSDGIDDLFVQGDLYFVASASGNRSLYRTSGTAVSTARIDTIPASQSISALSKYGDEILFVRNSYELWKLNPTTLAANMSADLGTVFASPTQLTPVGSNAFFAYGGSLWKTDLQAGITVKLRDIGEYISELFQKDGLLYFSGGTEYLGSGYELWRSDGTENGTFLLKDIDPGFDEGYGFSSSPRQFLIFRNELYFIAGVSIWKTDGTQQGTTLFESAYAQSLHVFQDKLYFVTRKNPSELAPSLRDVDLPTSIDILRPGPGSGGSSPSTLIPFQGQLYFSAYDGITGNELWRTYASGTPSRFLDLQPGVLSSSPHHLGTIGNRLVFFAWGPAGFGLWSTDGTITGTQFLKAIQYSDGKYIQMGNSLYFTGFTQSEGWELWKTDGTPSGTSLVKDINAGSVYDPETGVISPKSSFPTELTIFKDRLYFRAGSELEGQELWSTDGSTSGTTIVKDILPGQEEFEPYYPFDSFPSRLMVLNGSLYFIATDETGRFLWRTDGTTNGTVNTNVVMNSTFDPNFQMAVLGDQILFTQRSWLRGLELWGTQGTPEKTYGIRDVRPGQASSGISSLMVAGDVAFFVADDGVSGRELWSTDGTTAGTRLVQDINTGVDPATGLARSSNPQQFTHFNGVLYFTAETPNTGRELWRTHGTAPGASLVRDINPGPGSSHPTNLRASGRDVWFSAETDIGRELWRARVSPPDIVGLPSQVTTSPNAVPLRFASSASIVDDATATYAGGRFRVVITNPASSLDRLGIQAVSGISTTSTQIFYLGIEIAKYTNSGRVLNFVLNSNATPTAITALLRSLTFATTHSVSSPLSRRITFELWDGEGGGAFRSLNISA